MTTQPAPHCPRCASFLIYTSIWHQRYCASCCCPLPPAPAPMEEQEAAALARRTLLPMPWSVVP